MKKIPEKKLIIAVLRGHSSRAIQKINWEVLAETARREGMSGLLYRQIKDKKLFSPLLSFLRDYYRSITALNLIHRSSLIKIEESLNKEGTEVLALKGASLLDNIYKDPGMRPMEDLDLMVHPENKEKFEQLLLGLGYKKDLWAPHLFVKGQTTIDLHTHALNTDRIAGRARLFPAGMSSVWEYSVPLGPGFRWVKRPEDADNLLLLIQHLMKHSFSSLIWFMDILYLLENRNQHFWKRLYNRAAYLSQKRPLAYTLHLLYVLFGNKPPEGSGLENITDEISCFERVLLEISVKDQSLTFIGLLLELFCVPGLKNKVIFGVENLFPERKIMRQEYGRSLGNKMIFLYPFRILQLSTLMARQFLTALYLLIIKDK